MTFVKNIVIIIGSNSLNINIGLVKPPTIIMKKTNINDVINQYKNNLLIFFSFEYINYNIYFSYKS